MKAIVYEEYGPPDVLQLREVPKPTPQKNEVLIRIYATTVAFEDIMMRRSTDFNRNRTPKKAILGTYLAGKIEAVGKDVKLFRPGAQVFGFTGFFGRLALGTYAEYTCMRETGCLAIKPANLTISTPETNLRVFNQIKQKGSCITTQHHQYHVHI